MRQIPVTLLCLALMPLTAMAASPRTHFSKEIELGSGEVVGDLTMIAGKVTLGADSRAAGIRVDNGKLNMKPGSAADSVQMNNGEATLAGQIAGDVFCGIGSLEIQGPARVQGQIVNLGCDLVIGAGVEIGGDIISLANQNRIGPDLKLPGSVYLLPGEDRRAKTRDRPELNLMHDVHIAGGVKLGHCVQLERGNRVSTELFGVAPHEPLNQDRDRPAACQRLPGAAGTFTAPDWSAFQPLYLFEAPEVGQGRTYGDAFVVYTGLEVPDRAKFDQIRTINGAVVLGKQARAKGVSVVNGAVVLKPDALIQGPVEVRNGPLVVGENSVIEGSVTVYNSYIQVQKGGRIDGPITFYGQELIIERGGHVAAVRIGRLDDQAAEGKRDRASVVLPDRAAVGGELVFDRPARLKVGEGPAPDFSGVSPELKLAKSGRRR